MTIKGFVLGVTGNSEVNKDAIQKQFNYISGGNEAGVPQNKIVGIPFIKRILKQVDIYSGVDQIEDRFMPDGEKQLVLMVLESLQKGKKIQVQKVKAVQSQIASTQAAARDQAMQAKFNLQDKENINTIFEMFNKQHAKQLIESVYLRNDKNFEVTLDQFLNGKIPKDELKVVIMEESKKEDEVINTVSSSKPKKEKSDLLQQYTLGQFGESRARKNKNRAYYEEHLKAMELQKELEAEEDKDVKRKMLHLASIMQYEDDFDDQNFYAANKNR